MRKFYIQNNKGSRIDLNDKNSYFFSSPTGLGSTRTVTYNTDGSGFADVADSTTEQINIVGEIIITRNPYSGYRSLADFLIQSERLVLIYSPTDGQEYYLDVKLEYITKTEIQAGTLTCPVSFKGLSLWYRKSPKAYSIVQPLTVANPFRYGCRYSMQYTVDALTDNTIRAGGHIPAALDIYIKGRLVNPVIELKTETGKSIGEMRLSGTVPQKKYLRLCTKYNGEAGIWVDGVNSINSINLTDNTFFRLPQGTRCILSVTDDSQADTDVTVYVYEYYLTV